SLVAIPGTGSGATTQSPIFEVTLSNCNTLHVGYNRFPDGTVVHWRVNQTGTPTLAKGQFTAIGGGVLGSKTYHFIAIPLGIRLQPEPIQTDVRFWWEINGVITNAGPFTRDDPGCGGSVVTPGSCEPSSSLSVNVDVAGKTVVSYVPKG